MAVLDIIINAIDNASKVIEGIGDKGSSAMKTLADNSKAVGAGMTAAGGAIVLLTDSAKKTNAALGVTGLQLGKTSDEMRDLALETTNITFPLDDVVDTFDLLTRAGMRSTEEIVATSNAFSDLGTALGYPASEMADTLIPAFNAFDIPLKDASDYVDTFTHLVRNTTVDLSDYANMVNYLAPQLDTMNLSVEESVAVMEALADKGIQGGAATREFRKAATQAEGDVSAFYAALGLTADEVATYTAEIKSADGITQEFAEAQEAQFGMVDHLKRAGRMVVRHRVRTGTAGWGRGCNDGVRADHYGHWARYADPLRHSDRNADTEPHRHGSSGMGGDSTLATVSGGDRGCNRHRVAALR